METLQQPHWPMRTALPSTSQPCLQKTRAQSLPEAGVATAGTELASLSQTMPLPLMAPSEKPLVLPHCPPHAGISQAPQASCPTSTPTQQPGYPPSGRAPSPPGSCHRLRPRETLGFPLSLPPRLREVPQPEQHCGPERGVPAPRAPRHPPWLSPGHAPSSPDPALHPLAQPSPLWGDWG
uniref:Uncharacterized protein n=1 Tax=Mus spicilegus TaxID=10103 RepID=A0A8C6GSZ8_MUSSI